MKTIIIAIITAIAFASCDAVTQGLAIKHNDVVIGESDKVIDAFNVLNNTLTTYNVDSINIALQNYQAQITNSLKGINKAIALKDSSLKLASIEMIQVFKTIGENEFSKIRDIYAIPDSLYSEKEEAEVTALTTAIDEKIETAQIKQRDAQKAFAKKYHFALLIGKDTIN